MATVPTLERPMADQPAARPVRLGRGSSFELYSWYYFRVSGVLILFLALGHLAIMHVINNVEIVDYKFVAARWALPLWRIYDWLLLVLTVTHGANGVRLAIDDYVRARGWRVLAHSVNWVLMLLVFMAGTAIVLTFQPVLPVR